MQGLIQKYNVPGPRYTSYPTVPYWDLDNFSGKRYKETVKKAFDQSNEDEGISIYIHLPFCEQMCTFCGCHKRITKRHEVEAPYIRSILKEWKLYTDLFNARPRIKELHLGGGTPTFFSPSNLEILINGIFRKAVKSPGFEFSFEGHPNNTTKEHLQTLFDLGFKRVSFGVQDYSVRVQEAIHRIQPYEHVKRVTDWSREIGYKSVGHDLIYGLPHQTVGDVERTVSITRKLRPDRIAYYSYAHVPWLKGNGQRGFKDDDLPSADDKRRLYERGSELLMDIGYQEIGMDHFALKPDALYKAMTNGTMHRNFMGYTASKTHLLVGLGASSISDSWFGFAQNVKGVEEYEHLVSTGLFPIYRGHILSREDEIIRRHILNLMCRFKTSWYEDNQGFEGLNEVLERLGEMKSDGLVNIKPFELEVTERGRPFIRNACMAFDLHLHRKAPDTQLFSMTI
ncbi:MAG: oxygen-independent coproporphyrinogen III oxidase [Flavobacteriaceae bacterium]